MNKYDFDFRKIEDVLYDVLGITNPTDIISLKMQIHESLNSLAKAIDRKGFNQQEDKIESQKNALYKELNSIATETDLDRILRKCITIRYLILLSLEVKVRYDDSFDVKAKKQEKRSEIFALSSLVKSVSSIVDFMEKRKVLLSYIDSENRVINYNTNWVDEKNDADEQNDMDFELYPDMHLEIKFNQKPTRFPEKYNEVLESAGIYVYDFGELIYSSSPNGQGQYIQQLGKKRFVGVIKKDEFGELKKYSVLMNEKFDNVPPEFYRDIMFSDMLLRNSKNNLGYLGNIESFLNDEKFGYKVIFEDVNLEELLRTIYFENDPDKVSVKSNLITVISVKEAYKKIEEKLEKAIRELFDKENSDKTVGDD